MIRRTEGRACGEKTHPLRVERGRPDRCTRCGGMMIETYSDLVSPSEKGEDVYGRRCVNCGEYVDATILANRWLGSRSTHKLLTAMRRRACRSTRANDAGEAFPTLSVERDASFLQPYLRASDRTGFAEVLVSRRRTP